MRLRRRLAMPATGTLCAGPARPSRGRFADHTRPPRVLSAAGRARSVQSPGFAVLHLGRAGPLRSSVGALRLRYADGWRDWRRCSPPTRPNPVGTGTCPSSGDAAAYRGRACRRGHRPAAVTPSTPCDGPSTSTPPDRVRRWSGLTYLSRAGWGADESLRFEPDGTEKFPPAFFHVQTLTVHHTGDRQQRPGPRRHRARLSTSSSASPPTSATSATTCSSTRPARCTRAATPGRIRPVFGPRRVGPPTVDGQRGARRRLQRRQRRGGPAR